MKQGIDIVSKTQFPYRQDDIAQRHFCLKTNKPSKDMPDKTVLISL